MVGVVMRDEDVAESAQGYSSLDQLECRAVAGIDDIRHTFVDDEIGRWARYITVNGRAAARSKQHHPVRSQVVDMISSGTPLRRKPEWCLCCNEFPPGPGHSLHVRCCCAALCFS